MHLIAEEGGPFGQARQRWAVGPGHGKHVGPAHGQAERSEAAHGHPADGAMPGIRDRPEAAVYLGHQVVRYIGGVARAAIGSVHPVALVSLRHDDEHRLDVAVCNEPVGGSE